MYPRCPLSVQRLSLWDPSAFHYKGSPGRRGSCLVAKGKRQARGWVCGPEISQTETKEIPVAMCTPLYLKTFSELCKIDHRQVLLVCSLSPSSSSLTPLLSPSFPPPSPSSSALPSSSPPYFLPLSPPLLLSLTPPFFLPFPFLSFFLPLLPTSSSSSFPSYNHRGVAWREPSSLLFCSTSNIFSSTLHLPTLFTY